MPVELRKRVVEAWERGEGTFASLASHFKAGEASVNRWLARKRTTGTVEPAPMGGARRQRVVDTAGEAFLRSTIQGVPDSTLAELSEAYKEEFGVDVSSQTMSRTLASDEPH